MKDRTITDPTIPFFVLSFNETGKLAGEPRAFNSQSEAMESADCGVGVQNYVVGTISVVDRMSPPIEEIEREIARLSMDIVKGRQESRSTSPQCIPVAQYKQLARLTAQYEEIKRHQLLKPE